MNGQMRSRKRTTDFIDRAIFAAPDCSAADTEAFEMTLVVVPELEDPESDDDWNWLDFVAIVVMPLSVAEGFFIPNEFDAIGSRSRRYVTDGDDVTVADVSRSSDMVSC